jgi:putative cardiolipin synthase
MKTIFGFLLILLSLSVFAQEQRKLSDMIPHPFYVKDTSGQNQVMSIIDGYAAFQLRLEMIRRAQKNIEVEYFIYNTDMAGKILSRELVEAAKRGVKVRILIDKSKPIFQFTEQFARILANNNIAVRYYNNAPVLKISSVQFRNHRKLLSVDDAEAITGGRNIGEDYFDLSHHFNFNDTDVYIKGPAVKVMRESFDAYFEHKIAERPNLERLGDEKNNKLAEDFLAESEEEIRIRERLQTYGKKTLESIKLHTCPELTYVTDAPGARFRNRILPGFIDKYKFVRKTLFDKLNEVDKSVIMSSPYLLINKHSNALMKMLLKKKVDITVYTNSLASTDAVYVASNLYFDVYRWVDKGIKVHLHDGKYIGINPNVDEEVKNARWGTHSKVQIYEASTFTEAMVGTYNIDNRSNFYNSEMVVFCRGNNEYTAQVKDGVMEAIHKGIQINSDGTAQDRDGNKKDVFGSSRKGLLIMNLIFLPSWLLKFLL